MAGQFEGRPVVLRPVDHACLEGLEHLGEGHRRRVAAERRDHVDIEVVVHHADLHALEIGGRDDRLFRVVEAARAAVVPGERHEALLLHRVGEGLSDLAVERIEHLVRAGEQERQREHVGLGDDRPHRSHVEVGEIERAGAGLLDGVGLRAEHAVVEDRRRHAALGVRRDLLRELLERHRVRVALGVDVPAAPVGGRHCGRGCDEGGRAGRAEKAVECHDWCPPEVVFP